MPASRTGGPEQSRFLRFRKETLDTAIAANRIVCRGLLQKADQDIRVLSEAVQVGLELVLPSAWSERLAVSDTKGSKSDALMRAGTLLLRSAKDTVAIAAETRSELHRLIWDHLKETAELISAGNSPQRHGDGDVITNKKSSRGRPSSKVRRKRSAELPPKSAVRASHQKTQVRTPGRRSYLEVDDTAAHGSSADAGMASQQVAQKPVGPSEE